MSDATSHDPNAPGCAPCLADAMKKPLLARVLEKSPEAENTNVVPSLLNTPVENPPEPSKKLKRSVGDFVFDWGVYGLIGGVVNFGLSLASAYSARYGKAARKVEQWTRSLQKTGLSRDTSEKLLLTTALMMGGNIVLLPIKWFENYREKAVEIVNQSVGCEPSEKTAPPKQTWGSLVKGRIIAWLTVFAAFKTAVHVAGEDKFAQFEKDFATHVICKPLGMPTHIAGQETKLYRYGRIAALDVFATTAAATLLYIASRFFARKNKDLAEGEAERAFAPLELANGEETTEPAPSPASRTGKEVRFSAHIAPHKTYEERALVKAESGIGQTVH